MTDLELQTILDKALEQAQTDEILRNLHDEEKTYGNFTCTLQLDEGSAESVGSIYIEMSNHIDSHYTIDLSEHYLQVWDFCSLAYTPQTEIDNDSDF